MTARTLCLVALACACSTTESAPRDAGVEVAPAVDHAVTPAVEFRDDPEVAAMVASVSADEVGRSVARLAGFETRNSCSELTGAQRGVGAARDWFRDRFSALAGMRVQMQEFPFLDCLDGARLQVNVVASIPGATQPERLIVIGGHYDSMGSITTTGRVDGTLPAPGANDSGSQTAVLLEAVRAMAGRRFEATVVFVAFAGEEQGLYGSAAFVRELGRHFPGARVEAMLNCDIVGGDDTSNDDAALHQFRLYSAGTPREISTLPTVVEREGSADDTSPARNLMRYVGLWGARYVPAMSMLPRLREDRPGRGGDQESFLEAGIPAVRFIETRENVVRQHTPDDVPAHVSSAYVARIAQLVTAVAASLARAPAAPEWDAVVIDGDALTVSWAGGGAPPGGRRVLFARAVDRNDYGAPVLVGDDARVPLTALQTGDGAFFVTAADVDVDGHLSRFAYPEWRCEDSTCVVQDGSLDVTTTRQW